MSRPTLDPAEPFPFSRTGLSPSMDGLSSAILLTSMVSFAVRTPDCSQPGLGSFAFARRYSQNRCFFLFLRLLRCFSSPGSLRYTMYSCNGDGALPPPGFPIRISMDISLVCSSPWLFAAYHVLLRLLVPRHPPYALISLIVFLSFSLEYRLS